MKKIFVSILICSVLFSSSNAQTGKTDSLCNVLKTEKEDTNRVKTLISICHVFESNGNHKAADSIADIELPLSQKLNYTDGIAAGYQYKGMISLDQDKFGEALPFLMKGIVFAEQLKDKSILGNLYGKIGIVYVNEGNYAEALNYQLKCLQVREKMNDKMQVDIVSENIGNIYTKLGDYDNALKYQFKSLSAAKEINDAQGIGYVCGDIGSIYFHLNDYNKAMDYLQKSVHVCDSLNDKQGVGNGYVNIGNIYQKQGAYTDALMYFSKGLNAYKAIDSKYYSAYAYLNVGSLFFEEKAFKLAGMYVDTAINISKKLGEKEILQEAYSYKAKLDSAMGDFKMALADYKSNVMYGDSLKNEENTKKIVSEQMQYEFDKKQSQEQAQQEEKDAITSADKRKQQIIIGAVSVGLLLVVIFSIMLFSRFRITQKQKAVIEGQKKVVEEQKLLVEQQKAIVDEKNKDITDSIHYASRIQRALLTTDGYINQRLKDYFILFKPRDIVSGDFYWANEVETTAGKRFLVCAGDCTGHGVPGAFMSLLNISILNEANIEKKINEPAKILDEVREHIIKALNPEGKDDGSKDGMDCILTSFNFSGMIMEYSAAYNTPILIRNDEVRDLPADKMPVGIFIGEKKPFTQRTIELNSGDCIYLFTDGYADQFGGPKGKKFKYKQLQEKLLAISSQPMTEQKKILEQIFNNWKEGLEQVDDVLIIGIRV